jgi:hypothetical protein
MTHIEFIRKFRAVAVKNELICEKGKMFFAKI